ncbi:thiol reductant ABC exporter subunit CydC [Thiotrichales bacterium 19S3-7]|nr:thiol reductant ABC exporter subunit CydC [Thiotrichales bacterium 19S3-7]MCF6801220.1 thiol reductant ABC exporter subunit CydC [Thiotrichales bacterium 19S3-11]
MLKQYRALIPVFKRQLWWMVLSIGLSIATILSSIGLMSLSGWFISATAYAGLSYQVAAQFNFFMPATGVRFFSLMRTVNRYGERVISHEATFKILTNLRLWAYQKLEPLAPAHLISHKRGDLLNRMVSDVDQLDNLFIRVLSPSITAIIIAIISFTYFAFFNIHIAIITLVSLIISGFIIPIFIGILSAKTARKINLVTAQLKTDTVQLIHGLAELIIFNHINSQQQRINQLNDNLVQLQKKMSHYNGFGQALTQVILWSTIAITLYIAVDATSNGQLNGANIALIALGLLAMYESVMALPLAYQYLGKTNAAAKRLSELNDLKPEVTFKQNQEIDLKHFEIELKTVSFNYNQRNTIFSNFSLTIPEKSKFALVGETGSGKSTLLQLLTRSWDIQSGMITIGGVDIKAFSEAQLRQLIVFIEQQAHLFQSTIRDNLKIANSAASDDDIYDALELVSLKNHILNLPDKLDTLVGEFGENFSGGQRKRLMLVRAALSKAPIILLDEPTENLDRQTETEILQAITKLAQDKTVIMSTHSLLAMEIMQNQIQLKTKDTGVLL